MTTDHPQHSTNRRPRNASELVDHAVAGLQLLAFEKARRDTHTLNIEPRHVPLLRKAAEQSRAFRPAPPPLTAA